MDEPEFIERVLSNPVNREILHLLSAAGLPDAWLTSGALLQTVWNSLTGRAPSYGIKDYDIFYFDGADLSWEAEDYAMKAAQQVFAPIGADIEIRNQARVHLWYEEKFGIAYPQLHKATDGIDNFLATSAMVAVQPDGEGGFNVYAPAGLDDIAKMRLRPNRQHAKPDLYTAKMAQYQQTWPELEIEGL